MTGFLTTHVLDTARGCPAEGIEITLYRLKDALREKVAEAITNADGRTDTPILPEQNFVFGNYELLFSCGPYLRATGNVGDDPLFLDQIPLRFGMREATHYHVPLLLSPYSYATYRGS